MAHGSLMQLENKKYRVCFEYGFDVKGKRIRKYKTFSSKKEATLALSRHDVAMEDGTAISPSSLTLKDWLEYWMENMYETHAAETSVYSYWRMIRNHIIPCIGNINLQKLKPVKIQQYYTMLMQEKELSPNTVIKHHDLLNSALKAAVKQEFILRNPLDGVERPRKIHHEATIYTPEQLKDLLISVQDHRLEVVVFIAAYMGLRREEICGLKWSDIDFDRRIMHVKRAMTQVGNQIIVKETKTKASVRKLHIPESLLNCLKKEKLKQDNNADEFGEEWEKSDFIVVWENGKPYRPNYISELFTKYLKDKGFPKIVLHELRHTFASISNEAGVQEFNIGKAMGHSNVNTTKKIYTHLFDDSHVSAIDAVAKMIDESKGKQ